MSSPKPARRDTVIPTAGNAVAATEVREFLAFGLNNERFALPLGAVREILKVMPISEVPRAPAHILGILAVRGRITTVIDLRRRLRMPPSDSTRISRILLVDGGGEVIGVMVDEVHQVYRLHDDEMEYAQIVAGDISEYVLGIGRPGSRSQEGAVNEDDILILLDPVPLLRR